MNRRTFLSHAATAAAAATFPSHLLGDGTRLITHPKGKADHCIFIWLGGGMSQIDTFDPKSAAIRNQSRAFLALITT